MLLTQLDHGGSHTMINPWRNLDIFMAIFLLLRKYLFDYIVEQRFKAQT